MSNHEPILEFESATLAADGWQSASLANFSLSLHPGELALVRFDTRAGHGPIADAAMGLVEPQSGLVRFLGDDWQSHHAEPACKLRGKIGRFFGKRGWVYHLDIDENVTLRERHHSNRALHEIHAEADRLARALGLANGLPTARPAMVDPIDLQRAACVRMLLGSPPLMLLDEPTSCLLSNLHEPIIRQINNAREQGAAVLWLTADPLIWESKLLSPTIKIDQSSRPDAVARLDTAFGLAFSSLTATPDVPTAAAPQASH